jgi:UDP-N-acetylmuramate--alanine ligase
LNFGHVRHLHFAGIGGAGMCGLAELLHGEGFEVSGCDLAASETTARLESLGIDVALGHTPDHLQGVQVLVISSAIPGTNPEVEAARRLGIPVIRRAEMLGEISRLKWGIAVAGTHGKTTTTSLTGFVLTRAGLDPTVVVGGRMHFLGAHARLGRSEYLVCEADEFDRSFLALSPVLALITNVEPEHLDTYGSVEAMEEAFVTFANRVPFYGATIACLDDPGARRLLPRLSRRTVTYGFSPQAEVHGKKPRFSSAGAACRVVERGRELGELSLPLPGRHMLANALGATAVALEIGVEFPEDCVLLRIEFQQDGKEKLLGVEHSLAEAALRLFEEHTLMRGVLVNDGQSRRNLRDQIAAVHLKHRGPKEDALRTFFTRIAQDTIARRCAIRRRETQLLGARHGSGRRGGEIEIGRAHV